MASVLPKLRSVRVYGFAAAFYAVIALLFAVPLVSRSHTAAQVLKQAAVTQNSLKAIATSPAAVTGMPASFHIQRLSINLGVQPGVYDSANKSWTLDSSHVFVNTLGDTNPVISSSVTVQPDATFFYGHRMPAVVSGTAGLVVGDILTIDTTNGYTFTYAYGGDEHVTPDQAEVLTTKNQTPSVILMTCTGVFNQERRIMHFTLLGAPTPTTVTGTVEKS